MDDGEDEIGGGGGSGARARVSPRGETNLQAARAVERSVVAALREKAGLVEKLADVIDAGLSATKTHWDGNERAMVEAPDWSARREFAKLALAYLEGLPTATVVSASIGGAGGIPRLGEALAKTPNARRAVEAFLARSGVVLEVASAPAPSGDR